MSATSERISRVVEGWFLMEPLFFALWTTHHLTESTQVETIRVSRGRVEYNPAFLDRLDKQQLSDTLLFEVVRIVLRHPYQRRQDDARLAYLASNIAVQELLQTRLPMPYAAQVFGTHDHDGKHFEFYYDRLRERQCAGGQCDAGGASDQPGSGWGEASGNGRKLSLSGPDDPTPGVASPGRGSGGSDALNYHADPGRNGVINTEGWDKDELLNATLIDVVQRIRESNNWGTMGGRLRERILATLRPRLNYRDVLRLFRASILSSKRRLTRMKPNRRYGFLQMGSRYEFCTKLLFAVDVSGSMGSDDLARGFSVVNQFFRYGVPTIDVVQFDTELKGEKLTLRKARREIQAVGRGGTDFQPIIDHIDEVRDYDGLIIFTDGVAPAPTPPRNRRTRVVWLFKSESAYEEMADALHGIGLCAHLQSGGQRR